MPSHGNIEVKFAMVVRPRDGLTRALGVREVQPTIDGESNRHRVYRGPRPSPANLLCWVQHAPDRVVQ
jgi:hypothetical protein